MIARTQLGAAIVVAGLAAAWAAQSTPLALAASNELGIRAQDFNLAIGADLHMTLALPVGFDVSRLATDAVVTVISHPQIVDRGAYLDALERDRLGDTDDEYDITVDASMVVDDSLVITVPTQMNLISKEADEVEPPTDTTDTTEPAPVDTAPIDTAPLDTALDTPLDTSVESPLTFYDPGVHPIEVELALQGRTAAATTSFVHVVPTAGPSFGDMSIGLVLGQNVQPTVNDDGAVDLTDDDIDELQRLSDTLAAVDAVPTALGLNPDDVPRGVFVEPAALDALVATDPTLAATLTPGLEASDIVAAPRLPFEASAAAAADQGDRYTDLLSKGEDLLSQLLPRTTIDRSMHFVHSPFTTQAAELQRSMGARLMVLGFDFYNSAKGGNGMLTDTSQLVNIALPGDTTVPAAVVDPHIAKRLDDGADDPVRTSIEIAADLLVIAQSIDDDGGAVTRHGMVLARSDLGVPDATLTGDLIALLAGTDGLRLVDPSELGSIVDVLLKPGGSGEVAITLPDQQVADLEGRTTVIDEISEEIFTFASMLPEDAPQIKDWLSVLDALPSTAVTETTADDMVAGLRDQFEVYRTGVQGPDPFTFTLTGRKNTLSFSLRNNTDTELEVRVRLSSPKLTFPDGDQVVVLPPQDETEVNVRAEALSNGKSSVFLRVYAPAENSDMQLIPETVLTARVSSLAGLGQLLTGAGLLLVLAWWGRHWQQTRRKRLAAGHIERHPSSNGQ